MTLTRRSFLPLLIAAPAIGRFSSLMPVRRTIVDDYNFVCGETWDFRYYGYETLTPPWRGIDWNTP